ncbi:MAG: hypothetical protein GX062_06585 [Firmicutes bacterium]|jgi:hypothetical protein|nr:hypothetical protein [Bacillota bacterium]
MTHTNHRYGTPEDLSNDYIVLIMPAKGINNQNAASKLRRLFDVLMAYEPIDAGGIDIGTLISHSIEEIKANISDSTPMIHGVYGDLETVTAVVDEVKAQGYGFSVVVSGLLDEVERAEKEHGIQRHSVEYALGILGRKELLPPPEIRKITTMCGHGLISRYLVENVLEELRRGKISLEEGAKKLGRNCVCGVFNLERAKVVLKEALEIGVSKGNG